MSVVDKSKPYRVGRSRTGLGLFATDFIPKGTRIIRYKGPMLNAKQAEEADNLYLFEISGKWTIDGSPRKNIARYANHSCRPNAESDVQKKKRRVYIRAIKNIEPGEEITYDYGTDYFKTILKPLGCLCVKCEEKRKAAPSEARPKNPPKKRPRKSPRSPPRRRARQLPRRRKRRASPAESSARRRLVKRRLERPPSRTTKPAGKKLGSKVSKKASDGKASKASTRASSLAKKKPRSKRGGAADGGSTQAREAA